MKVYNWSQVAEEQVNPLASRQIIHSEAMTLVRRRLSKGAVTLVHQHPDEQISMIERGKLRFVVAGQEQIVTAGETLAIPSNAPHSLEALEDTVVIEVFAIPPRVALNGSTST